MMEPGNDQRANVLDLLKRSCSFDSFFQCRMTNEKECSGLTLKWRKSVDSLMCNKEQHSLLNDALIKRTISIPSLGTHELICETVANNSIEKSTDMNICSEEDVLNCTFESCDIEGKGEVYVSRIIGYLEDVTGQSCEKGQLKLLHKMLNSEGKDITVNLDTFHSIMKQWIAECRQEGFSSGKIEEATSFESICILPTDKKCDTTSGQLEGYGGDVNRGNLETTELINDIECLEYTNRKLVDQNAKLQRSVEGFEETNVRLTEEIFDLKSKLKSSQQVLLQVKLLENELEDLKSIVKNLEDRNYKLQIHNRQLEKEQQNLSTLICQLQEENGKLIAEKDYAHWRNEELISEKVELKSRLYEAKRLLSVKDVLLTEKINQSEELKSTVDEYNNIIKGLKEEINRLQYHLTCEDLTIIQPLETVNYKKTSQAISDRCCKYLPDLICSYESAVFLETCNPAIGASSLQSVELQSGNAPVRAPEHSLQLEIEEIQQQKTDLTANNLPTPLCGMVPLHKPAGQITDILCYVCSQLNWMDFYPVTEELFMQQDFEEEVKGFLRNINALFYSKIVRDMYKGNLAPQQLAVTQNYQETERKGVTEKSELVAVEECVNAIPHRKGLKELQWSILDTEQVSEEGLSTARRLFRETEVMKKEIDRNTFGWEISDEEDYVNEKRTGAIQETLSFTVENATRLATETVWQLEFQMPPKNCALHVDEPSQKMNKTRCVTSSMPVELQRACQNLSHSTCQQQKQIELLYEKLFLKKEESMDNSDIVTFKKKSMIEYMTAYKYIQEMKYIELSRILKLIQNCSNWKSETLINFEDAAHALVPYNEKSAGGAGDTMKSIRWDAVQSDSMMGTAEQMQVALLDQNVVPVHYSASQTNALRYEDQLDLFTRLCSQTKKISLVCLLMVFIVMLVALFSLFSLIPWYCQKHSFAECTDSSFWSVLKGLLCPQIRLHHGAPPPV